MPAGSKGKGSRKVRKTTLNAFAFTVFSLALVQGQGKIQEQETCDLSKENNRMKKAGAETVCKNSCSRALEFWGEEEWNIKK